MHICELPLHFGTGVPPSSSAANPSDDGLRREPRELAALSAAGR